MAKLNEMTTKAGLEFVNVDGDCGTNAVICCAHKEVVAECDIRVLHANFHYMAKGIPFFSETTSACWHILFASNTYLACGAGHCIDSN